MTPGLAGLVAGTVRLVCGVTVRWTDWHPDPRPRVYFANHTSHLDALAVWAALPSEVRAQVRPVAAKDYWGHGGLGRVAGARLLQAVLIERHNADAKAREEQLAVLLDALDAHSSLIVFPEGTRGAGPGIGPFKSGLYHLSLRRPGLELVPVHLHNLGRILPKGALLPVPLPSSVSFGRPLQLRNGESKDSLLDRARLAVARLSPS